MSKPKQPKKRNVTDRTTSRRSFLTKLWLALGGLAVVEFVIAAGDFLRPHGGRPAANGGGVVVAGPIARFAPDSVSAFPKGKFYLVRLENGGFLAISRECTHLGCTVPWNNYDHLFVCPCHASTFDITGDVLSPPAPRALDLHPVRIENGIVKVDTGKRLKRKSFDATQAAYA